MIVNPGPLRLPPDHAMSKIELLGAKAGDISDWNHAWKVVSRLAAAHGTTLRQISEHDRSVSIPSSVLDPNPAPAPLRLRPRLSPRLRPINWPATWRTSSGQPRRCDRRSPPRARRPRDRNGRRTARPAFDLASHLHCLAHRRSGRVLRDLGNRAAVRLKHDPKSAGDCELGSSCHASRRRIKHSRHFDRALLTQRNIVNPLQAQP